MASAQKVCDIINEHSDMDAVSMTNTFKILGHSGLGAEHHIPGNHLSTEVTKAAINRGAYVVANNHNDIQCSHPGCQLQSAVIVPLFMKDHLLGTLKLYKSTANSITYSDIEMAKGLAYLFTTQLDLSQLAYQESLLAKTEMKALQAQIQPHFLFNALNTIISYCRTDAPKARELLTNLSTFLRSSFKNNDGFIPIRDEIEHIKNYLSIEEARFSNRLQVTYKVDKDLDFMVPPLILQPLVENSLKHGLVEKAVNCLIEITVIETPGTYELCVWDNGVGMTATTLRRVMDENDHTGGIGLRNVIHRIKGIYHTDVQVACLPNQGTRITLSLPKNHVVNSYD